MSKADYGVKEGQIVADKYRVIMMLGKGGMGSVWRCEHLSLGSDVALKIIKPHVAQNENSMARFLREARAAARLRSPHVVQILDHGSDGDLAFIAMEMLEGESLYARLKRERKLSAQLTVRIAIHIGRAIQRAHEAGIVHRDLKPDNVFLVQNDDEIIAKVLDFGIAKSTGMMLESTAQSPQTQTGALLGTPYYMSPEQATAQKDVDHRSDLWSLGVIVYECLLGERPYSSDSLGNLVLQICTRAQPVPSERSQLSTTFDRWWAMAQQRDPEERFQSAKEMTHALRETLLGQQAATSGRSHIVQADDSTSIAVTATTANGADGARPLTPIVATNKGFPRRPASHDSLPTAPSIQTASAKTQAPETLEAVTATSVPQRNRRALVMVLGGAIALVLGGALASRLMLPNTPADESATLATSPPDETSAAVSTEPTNAAPATAPSATARSATSSAVSASASATPPPPPAVTLPPPPRVHPPSPIVGPADDPLDI